MFRKGTKGTAKWTCVTPAGFEYFDHTADVGIRAWGKSLEESFEQAALGLVSNMVDVSKATPVGEVILELEADSIERLLYQFLDEVLFLVQTKLEVPSDIRVELDANKLRAHIRGEAYDASRHGHLHEIKAITFHDLSVRRDPPEVRVIVDI